MLLDLQFTLPQEIAAPALSGGDLLGGPALSATVSMQLSEAGTGEEMGSPAVQPYAFITPAGVGSSAFGTPSLTTTVTVGMLGLDTGALGAHTVGALAYVRPAGVSGAAVGAASVYPFATITLAGLLAEAFGVHTLLSSAVVYANGINAGEIDANGPTVIAGQTPIVADEGPVGVLGTPTLNASAYVMMLPVDTGAVGALTVTRVWPLYMGAGVHSEQVGAPWVFNFTRAPFIGALTRISQVFGVVARVTVTGVLEQQYLEATLSAPAPYEAVLVVQPGLTSSVLHITTGGTLTSTTATGTLRR